MKKIATAIGPLVLVLCLAATQSASADSSASDPVGDAGAAPDITSVGVANDGSGGLAFTIRTGAGTLSATTAIVVSLDTDKNGSTGNDGIEYLFVIDGTGWGLLKWNGSTYEQAAASSASAVYSAGAAILKVNKSDIGVADSFVYYADSYLFDANDDVVASDTAPDGNAVYTYTLTKPAAPTPLRLTAGSTTYSAKARAGARETVRVAVTRSDTGKGLASGTATCSVKVGTTAVHAVGSVHGGAAFCTFRIPASAHGKTLRGTVKARFGNSVVTKTFSTHIA
jgi:hypothetical protein